MKVSNPKKPITESDVKKAVQDSIKEMAVKSDGLEMFQFCSTRNRAVKRTDLDLNLCGSPDCRNCSEFTTLFKF
jgi:hypothetical protein